MSSRAKGIFFIVAAAFFFACMSTCVRLAGDVPTFQKTFFRNLIAVFVAGAMLLKSHTKFTLPKEARLPLFLRCFVGSLGVVTNFYAIDHMLLSDANMLNKLAPFFAVLFSGLLLREGITLPQLACVITAFGGALCILRPSAALFTNPAALVGVLGGLTAGFAYTMVRRLGSLKVPRELIVFSFSVFSCLMSSPSLILQPLTIRPEQLLCLMGAGVFGCLAQFSVTSAYIYAPASEISVYDYTQVLFAALLGFLVFHQIPDGLSFLGYFIIIGAGVVMALYNQKRARLLAGR